jgi:hypothetical protein
VKGVLTDIDNYWVQQMLDNGYNPEGFKPPKDAKSLPKFDVDYNIDIPGFLVQRATAARMLDPNFRISTTTVMDMLFPEIKNPLQEQARSQKDKADQHEISLLIAMIQSYREAARISRDSKDEATAQLYDKVVGALESQIDAMGIKQQPTAATANTQARGEGMNVARQEIPATEQLGSVSSEGGI